MQARDVMTTKVVAVGPETPVNTIAALLLERRISAVPVIDEERRVLGIVGEGDLMRREELTPRSSWWLTAFGDPEALAQEFVKLHGQQAKDVMTREVVTISEETPLAEIAVLLEKHGIKRVPVLREGRLVGIVSRADLLRGLAVRGLKPMTPVAQDDASIRAQLLDVLQREPWAGAHFLSIVVDDGVVHFWGLVHSDAERQALRVAAESIPGVREVKDHLRLWRRVGL